MKTWEVYKIALENPKAEFRQPGSNLIYFFQNGKPKYRNINGDVDDSLNLTRLDENWELLPQEVTWQEAIQAWINCKEVYVEYDGEKYTQRASFRLGCFALGQDGFNKNCFRSGKWYITQ